MTSAHLLGLLIVLAAFPAVAGNATCPAMPDPPAAVCVESTHGLAYGGSREDAEMGARALEAAAGQFRMYFGVQPPAGALILSTTFTSDAARDFAAARSLAYGLSWLPESAARPTSRRSARSAFRAQRGPVRLGQHENVLRHELGHAMYAAMYWPGTQSEEPMYGSPAPDWLDESAAKLMEAPGDQRLDITRFLATFRSTPGRVPSLAEFLHKPHPALALQQMMRRVGKESRSGVVSMELPAGGIAESLHTFYGQSLSFATFLIDASGDATILRSISEAAAAGMGFEAWLAEHGEAARLPDTLPLLQVRWDAWLDATARGKAGTDSR